MNTSNPNSSFNRAMALARKNGYSFLSESLSEHYLNPEFWQALGKALGWDEECNICGKQTEQVNKDIAEYNDSACGEPWYKHQMSPYWRYFAKQFYDLILTGQPTEDFWADLLSNSKN